MKEIINRLIIPVFMLFLFLPGCRDRSMERASTTVPEPVQIRIAAVGDFLMHTPLNDTSRDPRTGKYDFKDMFKECGQYLAGPDFTMANLETRLAGPARGYSGYPLFNTPDELAFDMKDLGIDLITTANNHSLDMGRDGVIKTLDTLDRAGLYHVGTHRSAQERDKLAVLDIRGIKVGFINYTQDTNGIPVPRGEEYLVNMINRESMAREIGRLRESGCDMVIACIHFGDEYKRQPNESQRALALRLFEAGADVVLGSHSHVVQPLEWQRVVRDGREIQVLAAYSLGNFVSNQHWRYSDCGIILNLDIVKRHGESARLEGASYIPVWVHAFRRDGRPKYRVLPVEKAMEDYEMKKDPLVSENDYRNLKQVWQDTTGLMQPVFSTVR